MNCSWIEPAYEAARTWALQPLGRPPVGWAQMVRCGIASLAVQGLPSISASPERPQTPVRIDGLLTIVAAMIAEVCQ